MKLVTDVSGFLTGVVCRVSLDTQVGALGRRSPVLLPNTYWIKIELSPQPPTSL